MKELKNEEFASIPGWDDTLYFNLFATPIKYLTGLKTKSSDRPSRKLV